MSTGRTRQLGLRLTCAPFVPQPQSSHPVAPARVKSPSAEPEDEDERADRKRRELQKELEAKKKAPPKKKRRF